MRKPKIPPVSLRDIAVAAKVSKAAVSYALQQKPGVSKTTRQRVLRVAKRLGYSRDARLGSWMVRLRDSRAKSLLPIAWLNTDPNIATFGESKFMSPYLEGAQERCFELGYRLDEMWTREPGLTMRRMSRTLYERGIEGVIVCHPARHVLLNFDHLAGVSLEGALLAPRLHRVMNNHNFNLMLAIKSVKRLGYRRIGVCLSEEVDRVSDHVIRSTTHFLNTTGPGAERTKPLFLSPRLGEAQVPQIEAWLKKEKPEVVVCLDNRMVQWIKGFGYRVPEDIGVVHLAIDDDVLDWAGIYSNRRAIGRTAIELVISLMQNRQFGLPEIPNDTLISGSWRHGRTLLPRK